MRCSYVQVSGVTVALALITSTRRRLPQCSMRGHNPHLIARAVFSPSDTMCGSCDLRYRAPLHLMQYIDERVDATITEHAVRTGRADVGEW